MFGGLFLESSIQAGDVTKIFFPLATQIVSLTLRKKALHT
jgi:hypothetical protein